MLPRSTFVLGGAASGKSSWAEEFLEKDARPMVYLATGQIFDDEVAAKVKIHRDRRDARWRTVEAPLDLAPVLADLTDAETVLVDCATMWLTNHLMQENDLAAAQSDFLQALRNCAAPWVIVSNEVGHGIVPDNALARRFREAQGRLNIALAAEADLVVHVTVGLPQVLKGVLP
ncbi:bifunctional adenosylcobinamide kinase/adenosylcobinamide-phosphate guanylyltransferase [Sulfitobacter mediterraneus]|jgi:adenosylcobinamide kinase / adenosylcobinamide-phosphate guanylyltransferase|uniref:bifunctional adenosylcobinamide kinase/adenosylcobinamide-phosphate guanylyltransferase n=1 Tax=Sulfitobacter TaxID=60136 RepID=UPI001932F3E3|nr:MULTISPECIES: bifunctional adenosylcobinamide kinase/adenosylcobinamide-phosphate guanylyltransferase [Sulfitobacter]MBM1634231.1 bifunctional adenosylcobinamide kinase/adenosylcobinamide-phosphate guanylyltransferase [Sulfitobacter mediterraneus]MBM1642048.1 bifunctional adenosylcobinamide kinase/adenosylcobinamide-phosphate guanylyltransferase [Sulfitobacter mediterraneus]MBM1646097.1 bifunctional adenosylcobinamide kinase/adenosylcobinamide-phosphate guanylyltransferase [Sulfitobacter medi